VIATIVMINTKATAAENERAWRETVSTVGTLVVVCVVMLLALYHLRDMNGVKTATDNLIGTVAYIAAFVLPFLLLGFFANVITMIWCWPKRNAAGEPLYIDAGKVRLRRLIAYAAVLVLAAVVVGLLFLRYWQAVTAAT
jgi:hypothetical protein